jgi:hypothetical protein
MDYYKLAKINGRGMGDGGDKIIVVTKAPPGICHRRKQQIKII